MNNDLRIGCVLMAAGDARRFGENKLFTLYEGRPLIEHALDVIPFMRFCQVAVVSQYESVLDMARDRGFTAVHNGEPEKGVSLTVKLGLAVMPEAQAALFMVADQPRLKQESIEGALDLYLQEPGQMVCMGHGERRGNPAIFPRTYFPALRALKGDVGGSAIYNAHPDELRLYQVADAAELFDVDDPAALAELKRL